MGSLSEYLSRRIWEFSHVFGHVPECVIVDSRCYDVLQEELACSAQSSVLELCGLNFRHFPLFPIPDDRMDRVCEQLREDGHSVIRIRSGGTPLTQEAQQFVDDIMKSLFSKPNPPEGPDPWPT